MGDSLQDQLLKAGLASRKQAVRAKKAKGARERLERKGQGGVDETRERARRDAEAKLARDRELNRRRDEAAERRALAAQIRQLVADQRVAERGEVEFRFTDGKMIRTLMLRERERLALVGGALAVVRVGRRYELVPRAVADKVAERDASAVVLRNDGAADERPSTDDEYAGYEVPDDLMW